MLRRWRTHERSAIASKSCKGRGGERVELNALSSRESCATSAKWKGRETRAWRYVRWDPLLKGFNGVKFRVAVGRWFCVRNGEGPCEMQEMNGGGGNLGVGGNETRARLTLTRQFVFRLRSGRLGSASSERFNRFKARLHTRTRRSPTQSPWRGPEGKRG